MVTSCKRRIEVRFMLKGSNTEKKRQFLGLHMVRIYPEVISSSIRIHNS